MEENQQYNENIMSKYSNNILRLLLATAIICALLTKGQSQQSHELFIGGQLYVEQGASVYVVGDLHIDGAIGQLNNDGFVQLQGDLYKTNDAQYNDTGLGTVSFNNQQIPTTQGQSVYGDFTGANAIGNLSISSPVIGSLFRLRTGDLEVTNTLQMTDIVLRTDDASHAGDGAMYANEVYISNPDPNALQLSGSPSSTYIEGKLRREVAAGNTYIFDISNGMVERESFELSFHTTPSDFNVLTYFQNQQDNSLNLSASCNGSNYHADISTGRWVTTPSQAGGYTYDVILMPGTNPLTQHGTYPYNAIAEGGTLTTDCLDGSSSNFSGNNTLAAQNLSNLSYFEIVGLSPNLSIELERIWAEVEGNNINVHWTTASETDNMGFELERSTDAINFERIEWIEGQGNSSVSTDYKYIDTNVNEDVVYYYRVKAIETSGKEEYSPVVSASLGGDAIGVQVFPNPISQYNESLSLVAISDGNSQIEIFNESGQLVISHQFSTRKGEIINFPMPSLAAGMHIVTMTNGEYIKRTKLMVTP